MTNHTCALHVKNNTNYCNRSDWVSIVMKTRNDYDMTDHIVLVYSKAKTELSRPILAGTVYDGNQTGQ